MRLWSLEETLMSCQSIDHSLSCSTVSPNLSPTLVSPTQPGVSKQIGTNYVGLLTDCLWLELNCYDKNCGLKKSKMFTI